MYMSGPESVGSLSTASSSSSPSCSPTGSFGRGVYGGSSSHRGETSLGVLGLAAHEGTRLPPLSQPPPPPSRAPAAPLDHLDNPRYWHSGSRCWSSSGGNPTSSFLNNNLPPPTSEPSAYRASPPTSGSSSTTGVTTGAGGPPSPTSPNTNQIANELFRLFMTPGGNHGSNSAALGLAGGLGALPGALPTGLPPLHHPAAGLPPLDPRAGLLPGHHTDLHTGGSCWEDFSQNGRDTDLDELDRLLRGLEVRDSRQAVMNLPDFIPGADAKDTEILTKSRLLEILREREKQRSKRRGLLNKTAKQGKVCVFCRNNGEAEAVYTSHQLKDSDGKITCPVLYIYTCPICGANGPHAHTIKYCPLNPGDTPNIRSLKTARTSAGRRRNLPL